MIFLLSKIQRIFWSLIHEFQYSATYLLKMASIFRLLKIFKGSSFEQKKVKDLYMKVLLLSVQ